LIEVVYFVVCEIERLTEIDKKGNKGNKGKISKRKRSQISSS
jgi:hypothetical protein